MTAQTTLNAIRKHGPCESGWRKLLAHLGKTQADDAPLPFETILDSNGLDDALWCLRSLPEAGPVWRLYAVWCASRVRHLMTDPRSLAALDVARRHALGEATDEELAAACSAASDAASDTAWAAACSAASDAASDTAWGAARAAWDAARAAAQAEILRRVFRCPTMGAAMILLNEEIDK